MQEKTAIRATECTSASYLHHIWVHFEIHKANTFTSADTSSAVVWTTVDISVTDTATPDHATCTACPTADVTNCSTADAAAYRTVDSATHATGDAVAISTENATAHVKANATTHSAANAVTPTYTTATA